MPTFALRARVGQAAAPAATAGELPDAGVLAPVLADAAGGGGTGTVFAGAGGGGGRAAGVAVTVTVLAGPADGLELPQAATTAATQVSAAPASTCRAIRGDEVIAVSFCQGGALSRVTLRTLAGPLWLPLQQPARSQFARAVSWPGADRDLAAREAQEVDLSRLQQRLPLREELPGVRLRLMGAKGGTIPVQLAEDPLSRRAVDMVAGI